jgi:dCTP deaminase
MLTDKEILAEIENGNITIDPFDQSKIAPAAYYFTLGRYLLLPNPNQRINPTGGDDPTYTKVDLQENSYIIKPNEFLLGQTHELITLGNSIGMFLDGRTTLARLGLTVHKTASFIHPGHSKSIITLEFKNNGNHEIELVNGMDIGKGIFFKSVNPSSIAYKDMGIYSSQTEVMGADVPPYSNPDL